MRRLVFILTILLSLLAIAPAAALAAPVGQAGRENSALAAMADADWGRYCPGFAYYFYRSVMQHSEGTDLMVEIAQAVREGAMAYLGRQYRIVTIVFVVLFLILLVIEPIWFTRPDCTFCFCHRRFLFSPNRLYWYENGH